MHNEGKPPETDKQRKARIRHEMAQLDVEIASLQADKEKLRAQLGAK